MRPKPSDLHDHHLAPACGHCGLPLATGVKVCPFCDRKVTRPSVAGGRIILGVSERTLLLLAAGILVLAAVVTALAALAS